LLLNRHDESGIAGAPLKKLARLVVAFALLGLLATPALAILPALVISAAIHTAVVAGYVWWDAQRSGNSSVNTATGNTTTPVNVEWVDLQAGVPTVKNSTAIARVDRADMDNVVNANKAKYPNLDKALNPNNLPKGTAPLANGAMGDINGRVVVATSAAQPFTTVISATLPQITNDFIAQNSSGVDMHLGSMYGQTLLFTAFSIVDGHTQVYCQNFRDATSQEQATITLHNATNAEYGAAINASPATYSGEIDDFIKSNPNIVHFDDTGALAPPGGAGSQSGAGTFPMPSAPDAGDVASSQHGGNTATGTAGRQEPFTNYTAGLNTQAIPGSQDAVNRMGSPAADTSTPYSNSNGGDFSARFSTFIADMKTAPVFALPGTMVPSFGSGSSIVTVSAGRFGTLSCDLSDYNAVWAILKTFCLLISGFCAVKIVTLKGGGV
jgi:hypothetical protein